MNRLIFRLVIDALLLQPLKFVISLFILLLWKPSCRDVDICKTTNRTGLHFSELPKVNDLRDSLDPTFFENDGDGMKWLGMAYLSTEGNKPLNTKFWKSIISFIDNDGVIGRYPVGHYERNNAVNFSGDMVVGLLLALFYKLSINDLLSSQEKSILSKLWETTTFKDKLLTFTHPVTGKNKIDRGFLFPWYGIGPDVLQLLVWFRLGFLITEDKRYDQLYKLTKFLFTPLLVLGVGDYGIFVGRVLIQSWFTPHSRMCVNSIGYAITDERFFKRACKHIYLRHRKHNADIIALWNAFIDKSVEEFKNSRCISDIDYMRYLCNAVTIKGKAVYIDGFSTYFTLRKFRTEEYATNFISPRFLGHKYVWENSPIKPVECSDDRRKIWFLDVVFPVILYIQFNREAIWRRFKCLM